MFVKSVILALSAFSTIGLTTFANAAPLIVNGGFEDYSGTAPRGEFVNVNPTGWTVGNENLTEFKIVMINAPGTADDGSQWSVWGPFPNASPDGGNFLQSDGDPDFGASVSQTVAGLVVGNSYDLSFYQAAGQEKGYDGITTELWKVTFGGDTQLSSKFTLPSHGVGQWQLQTMSFIANSTSEVLKFLAVGTPSGEPPMSFLDGVEMSATPPTTVPEPVSLALLGVGIAGLGVTRLHRRQTSLNG